MEGEVATRSESSPYPDEGEPVEPAVELHIVPAHVNFQALFSTYLNIREGEPVQDDALLKGYEQFLLTDSNGVALRQAFDQITTTSDIDGLVAKVMEESYKSKSSTATQEMIARVRSVLPVDFPDRILYDPDISDEPEAA
jgi:hypothetical protein